MPIYRIVESETSEKKPEETIVETRLIEIDGYPEWQARNPGGAWWRIAILTKQGRCNLGMYIDEVSGLEHDTEGQIVTF